MHPNQMFAQQKQQNNPKELLRVSKKELLIQKQLNAELLASLEQKEQEIQSYINQLNRIQSTIRWRIISAIIDFLEYFKIVYLTKYIFKKLLLIHNPLKPYRDKNLIIQTEQNDNAEIGRQFINPYDCIELLKPITVHVINNNYAPISTIKFSTATTIYNEGFGILSFLKSIEIQSLQPDEVIIVDGGSTDNTIQIVEDFMKKTELKIKFLKRKRLNIPQGRNLAIKNAKNEYIVLMDAGTILDRDYCSNLIGCFELHNDADLIAGIYHSKKSSKFDKHFIIDWEKIDWNVFLPSTRAMAFKKSVAEAAGYYPEYLQTGDDTLFDINLRRISTKWVINTRAFVYWDSPNSQSKYEKVAENYGKGDGESGVGDFSFYGYLSLTNRNLPIPDPLNRMKFFRGYLRGRKKRAYHEVFDRKIPGVVVILGKVSVNDLPFRDVDIVKRYLNASFKVIYVSLFPPTEISKKRYFDFDYSLIEFYHINDIKLGDITKQYISLNTRVHIIQLTPNILYRNIIRDIPQSEHLIITTKFQTIPSTKTLNTLYLPFSDCQIKDLGEIYSKYLRFKKNGYFVEVGAYDGTTHSNTSFLADLGWSGLYCEPIRDYATKCKLRHKLNNVKVLEIAIGDKNKNIKLYQCGEFTTSISDPASFYKEIGFQNVAEQFTEKIALVKQITLNHLLTKNSTPRNFDILVLDTEGTERKILESFNILHWSPKLVIVEMHEQSIDWTKSPIVHNNNIWINQFFSTQNYFKAYSDEINTIFVRHSLWTRFTKIINNHFSKSIIRISLAHLHHYLLRRFTIPKRIFPRS